MKRFPAIQQLFLADEYAVSDHAIMEARKDGIEPNTVEKLTWVAINGKVIEQYPDRKRLLVYAELESDRLPVHIVIDHSCSIEPVIVTSYVPDNKHWIKYQIRKK